MFFSNTNRTNLTNLLGCDMVYIRGGGGLVVKLICQYSYGILSVYLCWTLGTR